MSLKEKIENNLPLSILSIVVVTSLAVASGVYMFTKDLLSDQNESLKIAMDSLAKENELIKNSIKDKDEIILKLTSEKQNLKEENLSLNSIINSQKNNISNLDTKNKELKNDYEIIMAKLNILTSIDKEIKKLEKKEEKYRECHYFMTPKPQEILTQCQNDLKYTQEELSKLRQRLPY
ncbi:Uncharacterised protein [Canicola haemoglobinophilus]|uniref:Uncharacterized protein n=1 Tax=Canicola haemoglobinophilus TaxID=733 RepID=A0AB38HBU0_9PAST|nr:hypothetical protein [Canicola haemoglobinophilus]STO54295.1 Uncharacterised protein [Canicola haemoglobinophilus]STO68829.1 Uncharacterised protein [Canicola haemoglobinophilus]